MQQERVQPDVITCSSFINACEKGNKNPERSLGFFTFTQQKHLQSDAITYGSLIKGYGILNNIHMVEQLWREMVDHCGLAPVSYLSYS